MAMQQIDKLTMMANQIAQFFKSYPHDEAVAGIASHIEAFWTPKMVGVIRDARDDIPNLDPLVAEALSPHVEAMDPAVKSDLGPGKIGELGAVDAG
jgi:formate dehydrogenase subunit delta